MTEKTDTIQDEGAVSEEAATEIEDVATAEAETTETEEHQAPENLHQRDDAIDEIAARRRALRDNEGADVDNGEIVQEETGEAEETDKKEATDQEDEDQLVSLKVDGEIVEVKQSEVDAGGGVAQLQKKLSGEKRLAAAFEEKKRLEALEVEQSQREIDLARREKEVDSRIKALEDRQVVSVEEPDVDTDQLTDDVLNNIYKGNEAEAKEALVQLVSSLKKTTIIQGQPALSEEKVLERAMFEIDRRDGQKQFQENYAHLYEDKNLFQMTNAETIKIEKEHPDWNPKEIILEAANRVDAWRKEVLGEDKVVEEVQEIEQRTEQKRRNKPIRSAQARSRSREGYKPRTQQQIFDDMKADRSR